MSENQGPDIQKSGQDKNARNPLGGLLGNLGQAKTEEANPLAGGILGNLGLNLKQKGPAGILGKFMDQQKKKSDGFEKEYTLVPADINQPITEEEDESLKKKSTNLIFQKVSMLNDQGFKASNDDDKKEDEEKEEKEEKKELLDEDKGETKSKLDGFKEVAMDYGLTVLKFVKGVKFFTTDSAGLEQFNTEVDNVGKKHTGFFDITKLFLQIFIAIGLLLGIFYNYIFILGDEKSQSVKYTMHSFLEYPIDLVPRLLPAHQFVFIEKDQIENRMLCKKYNDEGECKKIEMQKCLAKGETTEAYEVCMIELNQKLDQNTTQFCVESYQKEVMRVDSLNPSMSWHWERMHSCYEKTGVKKGREYCNDMKKYSVPAWDQQNLFNCYRKHNVDFAKEYCESLFLNEDAEDEEAIEKLLTCYGNQGVGKSKEYCDNLKGNKGDSRAAMNSRILCYDNNDIFSKDVCDEKKAFYYWSNTKLQGCYRAAGETLDKEFCTRSFPLRSQIDQKYECFNRIGLNIAKDRTYCELKYPDNNQQKFDCIDNELNPRPNKGGDYCYIKYKWFDEYKELYTCLETEQISNTSSFCNMQAEYKTYYLEGDDLQQQLQDISNEKWDCQKEFFPTPDSDSGSTPLNWNSSINCTKIESILNEESATQVKLVLNDPSKMTPKPEDVEQSGDKSMLQNTYAVGGGIRLKFEEQDEDTASYIIVGNYQSVSQYDWDQYGKLIYIKDADKDLLSVKLPTDDGSQRRVLSESSDSKRKLGGDDGHDATDDHSLGQLTPKMNTDFASSMNFIDDRQYNTKVIDMIQNGVPLEYEVGEWYFSHPNKLEVDFPTHKYSLTFKEDKNEVIVSSPNSENSPWELTFGESDDPQTRVVQNWEQSIPEKMHSFMKSGQPDPEMDCQFVQGEWKYDFEKEEQIQEIELFNFQNGVKDSLLSNAKIYIGNTLCAQLDSEPPSNVNLRILCENENEIQKNVFASDYSPSDKFQGTIGNSIRIVPASQGIMSICDVKVSAKVRDNQPTVEEKTYCKNWRAACEQLTSEEDKDNCLERFGNKRNATHCLNLDRVKETAPKFFYPLKNKYECLNNYQGKFDRVVLDQEVYECLSLYNMFTIEQCLDTYEKTYSQNITFIGEEPKPLLSKYGADPNNNILVRREEERQEEIKNTKNKQEEINIQVSINKEDLEFKFEEIETYLCDKKRTQMFFLTNPFDNAAIAPTAPQNEVKFIMNCEVFQWEDLSREPEKQSMWVAHYYMDAETEPTKGEKFDDSREEVKGKLNLQYFLIIFLLFSLNQRQVIHQWH